jgi:uncharacterized protein (DUF2141 family)
MKISILFPVMMMVFTLKSFMMMKEASSESGNIQVEVTGLKNTKGLLGILVFSTDDGFPSDQTKAFREILLPVGEGKNEHTFTDLPYGNYAISVMHDENMNKKLDTNLFGIPKEGTGVSNNVRSAFGAPKFSDAIFILNGKDYKTEIKVTY